MASRHEAGARMGCYVYVLATQEAHGVSTYVGWTTDLTRRLNQHNAGAGAKRTRGRAWVLIYAERYDTPQEAMRREWRLKRDRRFRAEIKMSLGAHNQRLSS